MAFVVEDGTGKSDANSYDTIEFIDGYFQERADPDWGGTADQKKGYAIVATDYVEIAFKDRLPGTPNTETQALHWPVDDETTIPILLQKAIAEYAKQAKINGGTLTPTPQVDPSGVSTVLTSKEIGPLKKAWSIVGRTDITPSARRIYPKADMFMAQILLPSQGVNRAVR